MNKIHKSLLTITSLIGVITVAVSLMLPFMIELENTAQIVGSIWMMVAGFVIFYFSNKLLKQNF